MTSVVMETCKRNIELELDAAKAPITVENFVNYVKQGFFMGSASTESSGDS